MTESKKAVVIRQNQIDAGENSITKYFKEKKITSEELERVQKIQCLGIARGVIPIHFWESDTMKEYNECLANIFVRGPNIIAQQISTPARTLSRRVEKYADELLAIISNKAERIGDSLQAIIMIDHQWRRSSGNEINNGNKRLGVLLHVKDGNLQSHNFLLAYKSCVSSAKEPSMVEIVDILKVSSFVPIFELI